MAGLGILGSALAGAAAGAGDAGVKAGLQLQKQFGDEDLLKLKSEADLKLGTTLENLRHTNQVSMKKEVDQPFQTSERVAGQGFTREMETDVRQPFQRTEREAGQGFQTSERQASQMFRTEERKASETYQAEQNKLNRDLTRDEIASRERIAANNNSVSLQVARIGGTVQQDKDGNMLFFDKQGKATPVMDPNNPGQQLRGLKDLTPAAKQYAEVIKGQLQGLDREELAASAAGDDKAKDKITERRAALNRDLLNVLTGGISEAGKAAPTGGRKGWDSSSGKVFKDGQEIGTAKSESDARRVYSGGGAPARPTPASPSAKIIGSRAPAATSQQPDYVTQPSDLTQQALQNPNLTTEQRSALSLQLQDQLKAEGKWDRQ